MAKIGAGFISGQPICLWAFGAHSFRGATTSAARQACIPIQKILARAQWALEHRWRSHYALEIMGYPSSDEKDEVTETLLDAYAERDRPISLYIFNSVYL